MQDDQATGATRCATCGATDGFTKRPRVPQYGFDGNVRPGTDTAGVAPLEKLTTWRCGRCGQDFETAVYIPDRASSV
jgi:hypothetical protein